METICDIPVQAPNAPDLVLDLLGASGSLLAGQTLCRAGEILGHREATVRVAITRLLAERKIRRTARGQYAMHRSGLTLAGELEAWNHEVSDEVPWSGAWIAVHDGEVLRSERTGWRHHHLALKLRGFATLLHGLQLRPANRAGGVKAERAKLQALGLSKRARVFLLDELDAPDQQRARGLWHVKELNAGYDALRMALRSHQASLGQLPREQALRETLLLGRTAMARLVRDPILPAALMPASPRAKVVTAMLAYKKNGHQLWMRWIAEQERKNVENIT